MEEWKKKKREMYNCNELKQKAKHHSLVALICGIVTESTNQSTSLVSQSVRETL